MNRRDLLATIAKVGGLGVVGIVGVPAVAHVLSPVVRDDEGPVWSRVGAVGQFPEGEVRKASVEVPRADWAQSLREKGVYVWHSPDEGLVVFARNCTDLSCPLEHDAGSNWFFCPCHGGIFSTDGQPKAGPPNRPMYRFAHRIRDDVLEIDLRSLPPMT